VETSDLKKLCLEGTLKRTTSIFVFTRFVAQPRGPVLLLPKAKQLAFREGVKSPSSNDLNPTLIKYRVQRQEANLQCRNCRKLRSMPQTVKSHLVGSGVFHCPPPFVVNLRGGDVFVVEQILYRLNGNAGVEQQGCRCGPQ